MYYVPNKYLILILIDDNRILYFVSRRHVYKLYKLNARENVLYIKIIILYTYVQYCTRHKFNVFRFRRLPQQRQVWRAVVVRVPSVVGAVVVIEWTML